MLLSEWGEFHSAPCLAGKRKNLMTARVLMLLKSRASLTCFRACFLPGRAKTYQHPSVSLTPTAEIISCDAVAKKTATVRTCHPSKQRLVTDVNIHLLICQSSRSRNIFTLTTDRNILE